MRKRPSIPTTKPSMTSKARPLLLVAAVAAIMVTLVAVGVGADSGESRAAETSSTDWAATTTTVSVKEPVDNASESAPAGADESSMVRATGPVPQGVAQAAAAGDPFYQLAELVWKSGGWVIPTPEGQYIIPMPEKIPDGFVYPPEKIPAGEMSDAAIDPQDLTPPPYLAPDEYELFAKYMTEGLAFTLEQGSDGYRHVVRLGGGNEVLEEA